MGKKTLRQVLPLSLSPEHKADLEKSGLSDETICEAKIFSVPPYAINKIMGWNAPITSLLAFPYPGTNFVRYKLFPPLTDKEDHKQKYHQPKGSPIRLYVPPGFRCWEPIWRITEGEKKGLAGTQARLNVVALGGVYNFAIKNGDGKPVLIDDLAGIPWQGKSIEIIPDGDFKRKEQVAQAVYRLASMLEEKGAKVLIVELPGDEKLDDYLIKNNVDRFLRLPRIGRTNKVFSIAKVYEDRKQADHRKELQFPDITAAPRVCFQRFMKHALRCPGTFCTCRT